MSGSEFLVFPHCVSYYISKGDFAHFCGRVLQSMRFYVFVASRVAELEQKKDKITVPKKENQTINEEENSDDDSDADPDDLTDWRKKC